VPYWSTASENFPDLASDGQGGAFVTWTQVLNNVGVPGAQHFDGAGAVAAGWDPGGRVPASGGTPHADQTESRIVSSADGAILTWTDWRNSGPISDPFHHNTDIYAQRLADDATVATEIALTSADVTADGVALSWFAAIAPSAAWVERRDAGSGWLSVGSVHSDGNGHLLYEDHDVRGGRYGYRLAYTSSNEVRRTSETWVTVPTVEFSLEGGSPNPASGPFAVSYSLPDAAPARIDVFDASGRQIHSREVGALGAGHHGSTLDIGRRAPGVYLVRLTHRGRSLSTKIAIQ